jgi:hypothetical protein
MEQATMLIFILFPVAAFVCLYLYLGNSSSFECNRLVLLRSAGLFTTYLIISLELLSLIRSITRLGLVIIWTIPLLAFAAWAYRQFRASRPVRLPVFYRPKGWAGWFMLAIITTVLGVTLTVAWFTPPQTWDSLTYHMSRVAHWAQDRSLVNFRTGIPRQISMNPAAEMVTLNGYVLTGGDRLAAFTQWSAMLVSLLGVSLIARQLGAKPFGQWVAAAFAATLPIGIVESSSTITDYVATFWMVCVAVESLEYYHSNDRKALFYLSLAAGLGILTKPTIIPYMVLFAFFDAFLLFKRWGLRLGVQWAVIAILVVGAINSGYLTRNILLFGNIISPVDFNTQNNQLKTLPGILSNVLKNVGLQAGLPYVPAYNAFLNRAIQYIHNKIGVDIQDPRINGEGTFRVSPPSTQEDLTSNPFHAYLILLAFILVFPFWKRVGGAVVVYAGCIALGFILSWVIFKWHVFNVRYHTIFFVMFAPVIGQLLGSFQLRIWGAAVIAGLFVCSIPWLFSINSRPLIVRPGRTYPTSILSAPRQDLYFANAGIYDAVLQIVGDVKARNCSQIGLMLLGDDPEYLFWALLGAPRDTLRIEWIVSGGFIDRIPEPDFHPCAIVCKKCSEKTIRGLDFAYQVHDMQLFLSPIK